MTFAAKLARLPPISRPVDVTLAESVRPRVDVRSGGERGDVAGAPVPAKPSLDELRDRIARVLARSPLGRPAAPADAPKVEVPSDLATCGWPFVREETAHGPLDRLTKPTPHGHRVGAVPVWSANTADPALLALLALDPALSASAPRRALYVDTETTGLSGGAGTVPFLVGLGFYDEAEGRFMVEQLLLKGLGDEAPILEHLRARLEAASMIVTFNGKAFDLPLLRTRAVLNRLPPFREPPHLDLLHLARRLHKHRLTSCSLQSLEGEILGRQRVGDVAGEDIAAIYHHYLRSGDEACLAPIVEHNSLDVVSMFALVGLYGEPLEHWWEEEAGTTSRKGGAAAPVLAATDFSAAARVARRGKDLDRALALAEASVKRGAGAVGHQARAEVAKARGDKASALLAYEAALELARASGEAGSALCESLRHELAKLYEHHARAYERAIAMVAEGTTEPPAKQSARLERLMRKNERLSARAGWSKVRPP